MPLQNMYKDISLLSSLYAYSHTYRVLTMSVVVIHDTVVFHVTIRNWRDGRTGRCVGSRDCVRNRGRYSWRRNFWLFFRVQRFVCRLPVSTAYGRAKIDVTYSAGPVVRVNVRVYRNGLLNGIATSGI